MVRNELERMCKETVIAILFAISELGLNGQGKATATLFGVVNLAVTLAGHYKGLCLVSILNILLFNSESRSNIQLLLSSLTFLHQAYEIILSVSVSVSVCVSFQNLKHFRFLITLDMNNMQLEATRFVVYNFVPSVKAMWWSHELLKWEQH
jgi:hypothetical protein